MGTLARLARPKGTLLLLAVPLTGYGFAHWDRALEFVAFGSIVLVVVAWTLLSSGTMWWNAALDGAEGEALFAEGADPHVDRHRVGRFGLLALFGAVVVAGVAGRTPLLVTAAAAVLSVLYSHPKTCWKGHPLLGPVVNVVGYGALSLFVGWSVVGVRMNVRTGITFGLLSFLALAATFAAQAFQGDDDRRRGYRTYVVTHGPADCLRAARGITRIVFAGFAVLALAGFFPRLCLAAIVPFVGVDHAFAAWQRLPDGGGAAQASGVVLRMFATGVALTGLALLDYAHDYVGGGPVCGLATSFPP